MCYEFVHPCNNALTNKLAKRVPADDYFLICIGDINYVYCYQPVVSGVIKKFFMQKQIRLHALPAAEMMSVIDFPGMEHCQAFHGSIHLLRMLRDKIGVPAKTQLIDETQ